MKIFRIFILTICGLAAPSRAQESTRLFPFVQDSSVGFINDTGKVVIAPAFDSANDFYEGLAAVRVARQHGYIDSTGQTIIPLKFDEADDFSEGLARVKLAGKYGYIDRAGEQVIAPQYEEAGSFRTGLARVANAGKWGYLNREGELVIKLEFEDAGNFSEDLARVEKKGKWGYINREGKFVIKPQFVFAEGFSEGLALVKKDKTVGYIDYTGEMKITSEHLKDGGSFERGLAPVQIGTLWGYIDKAQQVVIAPAFYFAEPFYHGRATVNLMGKEGVIDTTGAFIIKPNFEAATVKRYGFVEVKVSTTRGYLNANGQYVRELAFAKLKDDPTVTGFDEPPAVLKTAIPRYPELARRAGMQGTVFIKVWVDKNGACRRLLIQKSDAEIFDLPAFEAAEQFKFSPAKFNGKPAAVWVAMPFKFKLTPR